MNVIDIDTFVRDEEVGTIIMDIEGSEMQALKGARLTIEKGGVNVAVRVYHKQEDLITIPQYLHSLNNHFAFYLRYNHTAGLARSGSETTLCALDNR